MTQKREPHVGSAHRARGPANQLVEHEPGAEVLQHEDVLGPLAADRALTGDAARSAAPTIRIAARHEPECLGQRVVGVDGEPCWRSSTGSRSAGACRSRSMAAYTGVGSIDPGGRGQFVLVVAAMSVIGEERVDRRLQQAVLGCARRSPSRPSSKLADSARSLATKRPSVHSRWASWAESTSPVPPTMRLARPGGIPGRAGARSSKPRGAPASMLNCSSRLMLASAECGKVSSHGSSCSSDAVTQLGHRRQPCLRVRGGLRRARRGPACASAEGRTGSVASEAIRLRSPFAFLYGGRFVDLAHHLFVGVGRRHARHAHAEQPHRRRRSCTGSRRTRRCPPTGR